MPFLTDLDSAALRLDQHAVELRRRAAVLRAAIDGVQWQSVSADAFRQRGDATCTALQRCGDGLEHASVSLRRHAATARGRLAAPATLAGAAIGAVWDAFT